MVSDIYTSKFVIEIQVFRGWTSCKYRSRTWEFGTRARCSSSGAAIITWPAGTLGWAYTGIKQSEASFVGFIWSVMAEPWVSWLDSMSSGLMNTPRVGQVCGVVTEGVLLATALPKMTGKLKARGHSCITCVWSGQTRSFTDILRRHVLHRAKFPSSSWSCQCLWGCGTVVKKNKKIKKHTHTALRIYKVMFRLAWPDPTVSVASKTVRCSEGSLHRSLLYQSLPAYRRTSNNWIALGEKTSVYRGTQGSRRFACGPNENLIER